MRFFFYGTLLDEAVRRAVIGPAARALTIHPATLEGWRRAIVRGRHYPIVIPASGQSVEGLLADNMDSAGARRLDRFEGPEYRRVALDVRVQSGAVRSAWIYVAIDPGVAAAGDWDLEDWRRRHRAAFLRWLAAGSAG